MDHKYTALPNGQNIFYQEENPHSHAPEAIILIHGNFASHKWWHQLILNLQPLGHRIIALDLRGFGKSTYNKPCRYFGDWAQDVIELCKYLKIEKAVLIGWSFGGAIAQKVAELAPELVTKQILTCSVPFVGQDTFDETGKPAKTLEQIVKIPFVAENIKIFQNKNYEEFGEMFHQRHPKLTHYAMERKKEILMDAFDQRCYPEVLFARANPDIIPDKLKAKVLVIHGNQDKQISIEGVKLMADKLGKLLLLQNHGHLIPIQNPSLFANYVKEFIQS